MRIAVPGIIVAVLLPVAQAAEPVSSEKLTAIAQSLAPSLVRVEFTLQYHDGEAPLAAGWSTRCPNCGQYHINASEEYVSEERPAESAGYVLSSTEVVTSDPMIHPRFVKSIAVRFGNTTVPAAPSAYARRENAVVLKLEKPLDGVKPFAFDSRAAAPFLAATYQFADGGWTIGVEPVPVKFFDRGDIARFLTAPPNCLITDSEGHPVAVSMLGELPLDGSWKGSPAAWPVIPADDLAKRLGTLKTAVDGGLPRVSLTFRSPKTDARNRWSRSYGEDDENATQRDVVGVLLDNRRILVLADLKPKMTARLQRITVYPPQGEPIAARFTCTLKDYGALLAELEKPLDKPLDPNTAAVSSLRNRILLSAEVRVQGDNRTVYVQHRRISSLSRGWKNRVQPELSVDTSNIFLFDEECRLLALPVKMRPKVSVESDSMRYSQQAVLTPLASLNEALRSPDKSSDPSNVPLDERAAERLAWLGVELQPLNQDLARANRVAHLTQDGQTGALVTWVYPDSPAARAGVKQGYTLLRLHVPDLPKPLDITMRDTYDYSGEFPWDRLDELPAEYMDQLPRPWPPARNVLTQAMTALGFGKKFAAEFFFDGKTFMKDFEVTAGPEHFDSAPRCKSEPLGLTVCDLTYEVRRYFQKQAEDPGVVVFKVETGGKAAVSRVRPYEIITAVNDAPVRSAADFDKLVRGGGELRLAVEGKTRKRLVRLKLPVATSSPATQTAQ